MADHEQRVAEAVIFIESSGISVYRPSLYQLKFGPVNYYPGTGTITIDRQGIIKKKGLPALKEVVDAYLADAFEQFPLTESHT